MRKSIVALCMGVLLSLGSFAFAAERAPLPALYGVKLPAPAYSQTDKAQAVAEKATAAHVNAEAAKLASRLCGGAPAADNAGKLDGSARSYAVALRAFRPIAGRGSGFVTLDGARYLKG